MKKVQLPKKERIAHEIKVSVRNIIIIGITAYLTRLLASPDVQFPLYFVLLLATLIAIVYFFLAIVKIKEDDRKRAKRTVGMPAAN